MDTVSNMCWVMRLWSIAEEGRGLRWQTKEFLLYSEGSGDLFMDFELEESLICILERPQR